MVDFEQGKSTFGIEGYDYSLVRTLSPRPYVPRSNAPSFIQSVIERSSKLPAVGQYSLRYQRTWDTPDNSGMAVRAVKFNKSPRLFESQIMEIMNKRPDKSTPSPVVYDTAKSNLVPKFGFGPGVSEL